MPDASSRQSLHPIDPCNDHRSAVFDRKSLAHPVDRQRDGALADLGRIASRSAFHGFTRFGLYTTGRNANIAATAAWPYGFSRLRLRLFEEMALSAARPRV
jgi:hypothetical protein